MSIVDLLRSFAVQANAGPFYAMRCSQGVRTRIVRHSQNLPATQRARSVDQLNATGTRSEATLPAAAAAQPPEGALPIPLPRRRDPG